MGDLADFLMRNKLDPEPEKDERGFLLPVMRQGNKLSPAVPGILHEPYQSLARLLQSYQPGSGDEQPVRDAANVAGAVVMPGLGLNALGMVPRGALGMTGARAPSSLAGKLSANEIQDALNSATSAADLGQIWSRRDPSLTWNDLAPLQKVYSQRLGEALAAERAAAKADAVKTLGPPAAGKEYTLYHGMIDDYGKTADDARWFTTDREHAKEFGDVIERKASFSNPAYLPVNHSDIPVGRAGDEWLYERANDLFNKGHDAVFVQGWEGDGMVVLTGGLK